MFDGSIADAICVIAKDFHQRGWMSGTAGNLSARETNDAMWITASGKSKGNLTANDLLKLNINNGEVIERNLATNSPSAETEIHQAIYQSFSTAKACFHIHSIDACLATRLHADETDLALPDLEMIKGFGIWEQSPKVFLPVFRNHLDINQIAADIRRQFSQLQPDITALMIRDHGVTVWGNSIEQAYNRVEILEFLLSFLARTPQKSQP